MEKDFETEVLTRLTKIETKLDDYSRIKNKAEDSYVMSQSNKGRIDEIEERLKWVTRTTVGAIITGLISILFLFLKTGMGLK